jgi:hypothetical protein
MKKRKPDRVCAKCNADWAIAGEKFCKPCRKIELDDMKNAGYLQTNQIKHCGFNRTSDAKEATRETKYGREANESID